MKPMEWVATRLNQRSTLLDYKTFKWPGWPSRSENHQRISRYHCIGFTTLGQQQYTSTEVYSKHWKWSHGGIFVKWNLRMLLQSRVFLILSFGLKIQHTFEVLQENGLPFQLSLLRSLYTGNIRSAQSAASYPSGACWEQHTDRKCQEGKLWVSARL